jgi:hypothetical protein
MVEKAKSAFLARSPYACRGWTSHFRFLNCPPVPAGQGKLWKQDIARRKLIFIFEESLTLHSNQLSKKTK